MFDSGALEFPEYVRTLKFEVVKLPIDRYYERYPPEEKQKVFETLAGIEGCLQKEEPMSRQQVRIVRTPGRTVKFIKALRLIGGRMGLKQASDLALHLERFGSSVVVAGIKPAVAAHIADDLRRAGAEVIVEESSIDTPVLCSPEVNEQYRWGALRVIRKSI